MSNAEVKIKQNRPTFSIKEIERLQEKARLEVETEDVVREPNHYKHGTFETIDEMILVFGPQKVYDYCIITAWKYRARAPYKENLEQDMEKSNYYLELAKQIMDANQAYVRPAGLIKN